MLVAESRVIADGEKEASDVVSRVSRSAGADAVNGADAPCIDTAVEEGKCFGPVGFSDGAVAVGDSDGAVAWLIIVPPVSIEDARMETAGDRGGEEEPQVGVRRACCDAG